MGSIDFYKSLLTGFKLIYVIAIVTCHVAPLSKRKLMNAGPSMISHLDWHVHSYQYLSDHAELQKT